LKDPGFVQRFLTFLKAKAYRQVVFQSFAEAFTAISSTMPFLEASDALTALMTAVIPDRVLLKEMFCFACQIIASRPFLAQLFLGYIDLFLGQINRETLNAALVFLEIIVVVQADLELTPFRWQILTTFVTPDDYDALIHLIAAVTSLHPETLFLIQRPAFLPLLFFAIGNNPEHTNDFLRLCLRLIHFSDANLQALYRGRVPDILISALTRSGQATYFLTEFPFLCDSSLASNLLQRVISVACDRATANHFVQGIANTHNPALIRVLHSAVLYGTYDLPNQFPLGLSSPFAQTELPSEAFNPPFTASFWMRNTGGLLIPPSTVIPIFTVSDAQNAGFSVCLVDGVLSASVAHPGGRALVTICPRMVHNAWQHYVLQFEPACLDERATILGRRGVERLSDAEFMEVPFAKGSVEVSFGGAHGPSEECGRVAQIFIFRGRLRAAELASLPFSPEVVTSECLVSSELFFYPPPATVRLCLETEGAVRPLLRLWGEIQDETLLGVIAALLEDSRDLLLPEEYAQMLVPPCPVETWLLAFGIARRVRDSATRRAWLERVLINFDLWDTRDVRFAIYARQALVAEFAVEDYFVHFVSRLDLLAPPVLDLLAHLAHVNLTQNDAAFLFTQMAAETNTERVCAYLTLVRWIAPKILESGYPAVDAVIPFVEHSCPRLVALAGQCVHALTGEAF
jgi:hypothetical protein